MSRINLNRLSPQELMSLHRQTLQELFRRGIIRTRNSPQGDYAEYLVAAAFEGELAPKSEKSWDVEKPSGERIQVKSRVIRPEAKASTQQLSVFRSWDFDLAVVILFTNADLSVHRAVQLEVEIVRQNAKYIRHVNGWRLTATDQVLTLGKDITDDIRRAVATL